MVVYKCTKIKEKQSLLGLVFYNLLQVPDLLVLSLQVLVFTGALDDGYLSICKYILWVHKSLLVLH